MELTVKHEKKYQQFTISLNGDEAELAYAMPSPKVLSFTHTFVPESARGKGVASKLITEGLRYAEENNFRVIAACEAVASFLERNPEYKRLL